MLQLTAGIEGSRVLALDGPAGAACDFYFDDEAWTVRYLVVATGGWLSGRKVLIPPAAIRSIDRRHRSISVELASEGVRRGPDVDTHRPISQQHTRIYFPYSGVPCGYSTGSGSATSMLSMGGLANSDRTELEERRILEEWASGIHADAHLRSGRTVMGYRVRTKEGDRAGHVRDFLYDLRTWRIRYLVVGIRHWLSTQVILIRTESIGQLDWVDGVITVKVCRDQMIQGPSFDPARPPDVS